MGSNDTPSISMDQREYQSPISHKSKHSKSKRKKSSVLEPEKGSILISRTNTVSNSDRSRSSASNIKHKQSYMSNQSNASVSSVSVSNVSSMSKLMHDYQEEDMHLMKTQTKTK